MCPQHLEPYVDNRNPWRYGIYLGLVGILIYINLRLCSCATKEGKYVRQPIKHTWGCVKSIISYLIFQPEDRHYIRMSSALGVERVRLRLNSHQKRLLFSKSPTTFVLGIGGHIKHVISSNSKIEKRAGCFRSKTKAHIVSCNRVV